MQLEDGRMHRFVAGLLAECGALVEPIDPDGLEVIAPPPIQQILGVGEFCRFGFGASLPEGARRIGIESDWLDRFQRMLGERGRWSRLVLNPGTRKAPDAERVLAQELALENATFRLLEVVPAWTRYLVLDFRYTAISDEKREGTQRLAINLATGAMPEAMLDRLVPGPDDEPLETIPADAALPPDWEPARVIEQVRRALPWRIEAALAPFVKGLRRRLDRDLDRLHAYHNDLHREASRRLAQLAPGDQARQRETPRIEAIARDYRAKLDDVGRKYALRVTANWVQTLDVTMPVYRLKAQIRRRKAERVMLFDWNTLSRRLDPPPCEASWSGERPRLVCDDALHLVAPAGLAPCGGCGRGYCRACHRGGCPKCGHGETARGLVG